MPKKLLSSLALIFPILMLGTLPQKSGEAPRCSYSGEDSMPQQQARINQDSGKAERVYHLWCGGTF